MLLVLQLSIWYSITTPPGTMTTRDFKGVNVGSKPNGSGTSGSGNGSVPLKGQNMFNKSLQVYYVTYAIFNW
ncbi:hypothetical protein Tco_1160221 [Tanacetum coccineum]